MKGVDIHQSAATTFWTDESELYVSYLKLTSASDYCHRILKIDYRGSCVVVFAYYSSEFLLLNKSPCIYSMKNQLHSDSNFSYLFSKVIDYSSSEVGKKLQNYPVKFVCVLVADS